MARRGLDCEVLDQAAALAAEERAAQMRADDLRAQVNALSKEVGHLRRAAAKGAAGVSGAANDAASGAAAATASEAAAAAVARSRGLGDEERSASTTAAAAAEGLRSLLLTIPNPPADDCPDGAGEADNVVIRTEGYDPRSYGDHQRRPHWEVGAELGLLDLERGSKLSGSMFPLFRGDGARLVRALCQLALDRNRDAFEEVRPPTLVRTETMVSTGHLPKFEEEAYAVERDGLWAIPTAEVPLTSLARGEILDEAALPQRLMAHTTCYRREAGAAGRDTRGLLRVHEFDKVEILAYTTPEQAAEVHADLLARAEGSLAVLGLAYRVVDLCAGDISPSAARTFDLEVYAPGCDRWLEASSVSWFGDYQARRGDIRYRPAARAGGSGAATSVVHTLNGSALAVPRVWAALVETYRQPDGRIAVPEALGPYFGDVKFMGKAGGAMNSTEAS